MLHGKGESLLEKENNKRVRHLEKDEIAALIRECPKHLKPIVICALNTGMRKGEILSLEWSQVRNGFIYLGETKNNEDKGKAIPINDELAPVLDQLKRERGLGAKYVFPFTPGEHALKGEQPVRERKHPAPVGDKIVRVTTAFRAALKRAGIEDFRFHDLRHTAASHIVMNGGSMKAVQEILRHKDIKTTMRYAHLGDQTKKDALNLLRGLTTAQSETSTVTKVSQQEKSRSLAAVK